METQAIGRRQILRGAGVAAGTVAVATVGLTATASADDGDRGGGLLGAWMITRQDDGDTAMITGVASFAAGGVALFMDINPAGPSFAGAFAQHDHKMFKSTIISGSKADEAFPGAPALTQEVHTEGTRDRDTISGTYSATAFDATSGDPLGPPLTGKFTGTRIVA